MQSETKQNKTYSTASSAPFCVLPSGEMFDFWPFGYKIGRRTLLRFFQLLTFIIIIYFILFYLTWTSSEKSVYTTGNRSALKLVTLPNLKVTRLKGDVTRNDSRRRF